MKTANIKPKPTTKSTTTPLGYTGKSFNLWQRNLQREVDKILKTNVAGKYRVN